MQLWMNLLLWYISLWTLHRNPHIVSGIYCQDALWLCRTAFWLFHLTAHLYRKQLWGLVSTVGFWWMVCLLQGWEVLHTHSCFLFHLTSDLHFWLAYHFEANQSLLHGKILHLSFTLSKMEDGPWWPLTLSCNSSLVDGAVCMNDFPVQGFLWGLTWWSSPLFRYSIKPSWS